MLSVSSRTLTRLWRVPVAAAVCAITALGCGGDNSLMPAAAGPSDFTTGEPVNIRMVPDKIAIAVGSALTDVASATDQNGAPLAATFTWTSSNPAVATVSAAGTITGVALGTTTITVRGLDHSASVVATVAERSTASVTTLTTMPATLPSIAVGATGTLIPIVRDSAGNNIVRNLRWSSSDSSVATVVGGLVTGVKPGTATIHVAAGGKTATSPVTIVGSPAVIASVSLSYSASSPITVGGTSTIVATAQDANGKPVATKFAWASSNTAVATVDSAGVVKAIAPGTATVTATAGGKAATASVTVVAKAPVLTSISLTPTSVPNLAVGSTSTLVATAKDSSGTTMPATITWSSSNTAAATVEGGVVKGVAPGTATITASSAGKSAAASVTVATPAPVVASLSVTPTSIPSLAIGATSTVAATAKDSSGKAVAATVTWSTNNAAVATVNGGVVTGVGAGTTTITASAAGKTATATVTVPAAAAVVASLSVTPTAVPSLAIGATSTIVATAKDTAGKAVAATVTWTSSNTAVASVSAAGVVTGVTAGNATITATAAGKTATATVTVAAAAPVVASVTITPTSVPSLAVGVSSTLTAAALDASGKPVSATITWSTNNGTVATVTNGVVKGVAAGTTQITASAGGKSAAATVTVVASAPIAPPSGSETRAALPQVYLNTAMPAAPASGGQVITVAAGGNLQNALNSANPGDVIELAAGATFSGNFTLPVKSGSSWIVIRPSNWSSLPAAGSRMTPSIAASLRLPSITSPNTQPAIQPVATAHHYRFVGIEVTTAVSGNYGLVSTDAVGGQTQLSQVPHDLVFDRMYVHGQSGLTLRRCFALNSASTAVIDSDVRECHDPGQDSQAIAVWNGPGPLKIVNNYLEAATENVMFGGADPSIPNMTPSDIEIRGNHIFKPRTMTAYSVKNLFEVKHAQRMLVEGNIIDGIWQQGQAGHAIALKTVNQNGSCTWCVTQDITFRYNIIRNMGGGFNIASHPDNTYPVLSGARRLTIVDNVLTNINVNPYLGDGRGFLILGDLADLVIAHNTLVSPTHSLATFGGLAGVRTTIRDNVTDGGSYGFIGDNVGTGTPAITTYAPGGFVQGNVIALSSASGMPTGNYYPTSIAGVGFMNASSDFHLSASSQYKGKASDGLDPGANIDLVNQNTSAVIVP